MMPTVRSLQNLTRKSDARAVAAVLLPVLFSVTPASAAAQRTVMSTASITVPTMLRVVSMTPGQVRVDARGRVLVTTVVEVTSNLRYQLSVRPAARARGVSSRAAGASVRNAQGRHEALDRAGSVTVVETAAKGRTRSVVECRIDAPADASAALDLSPCALTLVLDGEGTGGQVTVDSRPSARRLVTLASRETSLQGSEQ